MIKMGICFLYVFPLFAGWNVSVFLRKSHMKLVFLNFFLLRNENDKQCAEIDFCHRKMKENEDADGRVEK